MRRFLAAAFVLCASTANAQVYQPVYLDNDPNHAVLGFDVNKKGEVAGIAVFDFYTGEVVPFKWDPITGMQVLTLPEGSTVSRINAKGQILGTVNLEGSTSSFLREPNGSLHTFGHTAHSRGSGLNDKGEVVGWFGGALGTGAFSWSTKKGLVLQPTITLGGFYANPFAVSQNGVVVGYATPPGPPNITHAFRWQGGVMIDLAPGKEAWATDVSKNGQIIVGHVFDQNRRPHATVWTKKGLTPLPELQGVASQVWKTNGSVHVGRTQTDVTGGNYVGTIWQNGKALDPNELLTEPLPDGDRIVDAVSINDVGVILCSTWNSKTVLLYPVRR